GVLISIDTNVYDELITKCPPAALKYVDDENEVIRVGSALELAQRLDDPPRDWTARDSASHDRSFLSHYHIFDIDHRTDILAMWTRYGERISDGGTSQRDRYFQATNPPVTQSSDQRPPLPKLCSTHAGNGTETSTSSPQSNLTGEGKRQAQAAGDLLRSRYLHHHQPCASTTEPHPATYQNRWASYSKDAATFVPSIPKQNTEVGINTSTEEVPDVNSGPINLQLRRPSKPYHDQAVGDRTRDGTNLVRRKKTRSYVLDNNHRISFTPGQPLKLEDRVVNSHSTEGPRIKPVHHDTQSSLIDVFNNELKRLATKDSTRMDHQREGEETVPPLVNRMQNLCSKLQSLGQRSDGGIASVQTVQHGICTALQGFCTAIQDVADSVQDESNAESLRVLGQDKTDRTLLDNAIEGLSELASATTLLQTQILPTLRNFVENATRQESLEPVTSMLSGERKDRSAFKQPGGRFEVSGQHLNVLQNPKTPFIMKNVLVDPMADPSTTFQASGPIDSSPDPKPSNTYCNNVVYPVVDSHPGPPQASRVDEAFSSTFLQNMRGFWADDRASHMAERRFPTLKRFEQESSINSPAFRQNPNKLPQMPESSCEKFPSTQARSDKTIDVTTKIANREPRLYTFRPMSRGGSHSPSNHEEPLPPPKVGSGHEIGFSSLTSQSPTNGPPRSQPPGFDTPRNGNITNQQVYADSYPQSQRPNSCDTTTGVRVLQAADITDHDDPATVAKTQACVEELEKLGFVNTVEGGLNRLVVYAQASGGDLVEAIDLIAEESQIYGDVSHR
ncbi:MAG: hypothetical protein L6R42_009587, partial [Xanthoria sp. 1 TBL-2021]